MSTVVTLAPVYFPDPEKGKPVSNGDLYIGIIDLDPEILANQQQVTARQENGSEVAIPQPISTGAGGVPLYNGSPVTLLVETEYSLKLLDSIGAQVYYVPNNSGRVEGETSFLSDYECNFETAFTSIGSVNDTHLIVDCAPDDLTGALEQTDNIAIEWRSGYPLGGAFTLTLNGPLIAGNYQIFGDDLDVAGIPIIDSVSPQWFGATGDGVTDDTAGIQRAIDFLQLVSDRNSVILFPNGTYILGSKLTFKDHSSNFVRFPITFKGTRGQREGSGVFIQAAAGFSDSHMFEFLDTSGVGTNAYYTFMDFKIGGSSVAGLDGFGIKTAASFEFIRIAAGNVLGDVFSFSEGSEITLFDTVRVVSCGNGITADGTDPTNDMRILNSEFSSNTGWAFHGRRITSFTSTGTTYQSNAKGALYFESLRSFAINGSNRFESNGSTGHAYTTPATGIIKADIHLNGRSDDDVVLSPTAACEAGDISTNTFTGTSGVHIYANALVNSTIKNNLAEADVLIGSWGDTDYTILKSLEIKDNQNFENSPTVNPASEIQEITYGATFGVNNLKNPENIHTIDFGIEARNYLANYTMNGWTNIIADGGGVFEKLGGAPNGSTRFKITSSGAPSDTFGITVPLIDEFVITRDRWVWFGIWATLTDTVDTNVALYMEFTGGTGVQFSTDVTTGDSTDRVFISMAQKVPGGATDITVGIKKLGTGTGLVFPESQVLALIGAPYDNMTLQNPRVFYGSAAPTTGTWFQGEIVYDTTPSPTGQIGWVCTTAGSPGTWKTWGAITA